MQNSLLVIIITLIFLALSFVYAKNAIHMFQQNRYEFLRYTKWLFSIKNIHFSITLIYVALMLISLFIPSSISIYIVLAITIVFTVVMIKKEEEKEYIKPLVLTARVKRQIAVYVIIALAVEILLVVLLHNKLGIVGILSIYLPYLLIYVMGLITAPIENAVKKKYENEARKILGQLSYASDIDGVVKNSYGIGSITVTSYGVSAGYAMVYVQTISLKTFFLAVSGAILAVWTVLFWGIALLIRGDKKRK